MRLLSSIFAVLAMAFMVSPASAKDGNRTLTSTAQERLAQKPQGVETQAQRRVGRVRRAIRRGQIRRGNVRRAGVRRSGRRAGVRRRNIRRAGIRRSNVRRAGIRRRGIRRGAIRRGGRFYRRRSNVVIVNRGPYYGRGYYGRRYYRGGRFNRRRNVGAAIVGGIIVGSAINNSRYRGGRFSDAHHEWCFRRYRSYRVSDATFQPYRGERRLCRSPYL